MQTENRFAVDAKGEELFLIYLKNIFFTIITIGIYYFWAKVNTQKYLFRHVSFQGQRFDYHGTGKENFIGFVKGIGIVLAVAALLAGIYWLAFQIGTAAVVVVTLSVYAGFLCVIPYLSIGSRRYFLSRTSFNNVRFRFTGSVTELLKIFIPGAFLSAITFGIYSAWFSNKLDRFFTAHTHLGNADFSYEGQGKELFKIYLKGILLLIPTAGIYSFWLGANLHNYYWNRVKFQGISFRSDLKGGTLLWNAFVSTALILFTLGIGIPWAYLRSLRMIVQSLSLENSPDLASIRSVKDPGASALADGIQEAGEAFNSVFGG
ncbi:DUF898 family protein [Leptospira gomenensis]|uniref:DUF898 family protein n=1 Tax=Leptospira gomenensis TaxID=2484974 RepID=A0A5F1YBG1_9LEPT|nr:DUF898 family protein [Leptospira gomenensis]TGK34895.1 DUF898 family protein [Leptospira gomenensis]TGK41145.1 DUF898 family protein [Leptospira gomenensis]TGK42054.1 DUF898 family protein [Leptospira gomenensis]TGK56316.1 DUF898 family protein [Leptospira gomenensis]